MSHFIGGWLPRGPYKQDKSDPFGWTPDAPNKRPCKCGHGIFDHEDFDGDIHECNSRGCSCEQFIDRDEPIGDELLDRLCREGILTTEKSYSNPTGEPRIL